MSGTLLNDALEEFFVKQFQSAPANETPSSTASVFAFEQFPLGLAPEQFYAREGDATSFSRAAVDEYFSISIADFPSSIDDGFRQPLLNPISDTYFFELLGPAAFCKDAQASDEANIDAMNWYDTVKNEGKKRFERLKVASGSGLAVTHSSTDSIPPNWLDPGTGSWVRHELVVRKTQATQSHPTVTAPAASPQGSAYRFMTLKRTLDSTEPSNRPLLMVRQYDQTALADITRAVSMQPISGEGTASSRSLATAVRAAESMPMQLEPGAATNRLAMRRGRPVVKKNWAHLATQIDWQQQLDAQPLVVEPTPVTPADDGLTVEFSYQLVQIRRPWLFTPFLFNRNWYVQGMRRGQIADFAAGGNGRLSWIPSAIVLVKDVTIRANWTSEAQAALARSYAVGPFLLGDKKTITRESLTISGIQWIASVSQALPQLPPRDDPALPT